MNQRTKQVSAITGHHCAAKQIESALLAKRIARFLKNGGVIKAVSTELRTSVGVIHGTRWTGEPCSTCLVRDEQSDFAVGDLVVVINPRATKNIFEVEALTHEGVFANECTAVFIMRHFFTFDLIRLATPAEKAAGRRIDAPTVCVEQETAELFNTKHCSPRNYNNDSALRVSEIKASAAYSKMALTNFTLSEKNGRLKTNNHALKAALAMAIVAGVVGWML